MPRTRLLINIPESRTEPSTHHETVCADQPVCGHFWPKDFWWVSDQTIPLLLLIINGNPLTKVQITVNYFLASCLECTEKQPSKHREVNFIIIVHMHHTLITLLKYIVEWNKYHLKIVKSEGHTHIFFLLQPSAFSPVIRYWEYWPRMRCRSCCCRTWLRWRIWRCGRTHMAAYISLTHTPDLHSPQHTS